MHHHKYKRQRKQKLAEDGFASDPADAKCPYCGKSKRPCSYVNSLSRSWARWACSKRKRRQPF